MNNILSKSILLIFLLVVLTAFNGLMFAATKGKISGTVVDKETGEPLPSVNIVLVNTTLGAATDVDGDFFILNIFPGVYSVRVSMIGYATETKLSVRVNIDHTTTINFALSQAAIEVDAINVTADREIIKMDVSSSQQLIMPQQITESPVLRTEDVIGLQAGVRLQDDADDMGFIIRGGEVSETGFTIDGMSMMDNRVQTPYIAISKSAIQEIQILTGGFSAEYGNIRSGLINIVTKEGTDEFHSSFEYGIAPSARKHFGPGAFDPESNYYQTYAYGPEENVYNGWSKEESPIGREWRGWNAMSQKTLTDNDPTNDLTPQELLEIWKWRQRGYDYAEKPDYTLDVSLGGPIFGDLKFFTSLWMERTWLAYPLARDDYKNMALNYKLTYSVGDNIKFAFQGINGREKSNKGGWQDNGVIRSVAAAAAAAYNPFNEGGFAIADNNRDIYSLKMTHTINPKTFYEVYLDYSKFSTDAGSMRDRDTTGIHQIGDRWYTEAPAAHEKHPSLLFKEFQPQIFGLAIGPGIGDKSWYEGLTFKADIVNQANKYHKLKAGVMINRNHFHEHRASFSPGFDLNNSPIQIKYNKVNVQSALYVQDKMEFEGMIANIGLRLDHYDPKLSWADFDDPFNQELAASAFVPGEGAPEQKEVKAKVKLSPRLGISHPVTENTKVYFNYGHFYQVNPPHMVYRSYYENDAKTKTHLANPHADWPKTVAYELGFEWNIMDSYLLHVAGYYKDITNELLDVEVRDFNADVNYITWKNDHYADYRGIELWIRKETGRFFTGWLNFDYMVISDGAIGKDFIFQNPNLNYLERRSANQTKPWAQPRLNLTLNLHTPADWGQLYGLWSLVLIHEWEEGAKWTHNPLDLPGISNNMQNVNYQNTNMRLIKRVNISGIKPSFYMEATNLFNVKRLNTGHFYDSSEEQTYLKAIQDGDYRYGEYSKNGENEAIPLGWMDFRQFLNPRAFRFGIQFEF